MKIVFFGTPAVAVSSLAALVEAGHQVPRVVTQPDRAVGRSRRLVAPPVKSFALEHGLAVEQPSKIRSRSFRESIAQLEPELLVVVAYGRMLSSRLIDQTPLGAVNLHFSLLPRYRGAAPVQWALANGEATTGVTTMCIDERLDEGDILLQRELSIEPEEHAPTLFTRLAALGAPVLVETLAGLARGDLARHPQDSADASLAPILTARDGAVDPEALDARRIEGRIRGFDPWPGVWLLRAGRRIRVLDAVAVDAAPEPGTAAGTLVPWNDGGAALVCAGATLLELRTVQPEGKRALALRDALNGRQLALGERLTPVHVE